MDVVTGLSGSGPAYVFLAVEAMTQGGVEMGLEPEIACALAVQTVLGAALLLKSTGERAAVLRERVSSPGGTTLAGLGALERGGFSRAIKNAIREATLRSEQLGRDASASSR
jgi:pyrroline-5-carboxylate reductase